MATIKAGRSKFYVGGEDVTGDVASITNASVVDGVLEQPYIGHEWQRRVSGRKDATVGWNSYWDSDFDETKLGAFSGEILWSSVAVAGAPCFLLPAHAGEVLGTINQDMSASLTVTANSRALNFHPFFSQVTPGVVAPAASYSLGTFASGDEILVLIKSQRGASHDTTYPSIAVAGVSGEELIFRTREYVVHKYTVAGAGAKTATVAAGQTEFLLGVQKI